MYQPRPLDTEGVELPEELLELTEAPILAPGSGGWERLIRERLGERAVPFTRYAVRPGCFDRSRLIGFTGSLPHGFTIRPIGREMYAALMEEEWSRDLCGNFADGSDFARRALALPFCGRAFRWPGLPPTPSATEP